MPTRRQLLELLYSAHCSVSSMTLEVDDWSRRNASNVLVVQTGGEHRFRARWMDGGPNAEPLVTSRRVWFQPPDQLRVEMFHGPELVRAAARNGSAWWRWDADEGEMAGDTGDGATLPPMLHVLQLNPARLLSTMFLEVTGTGERLSRPVLVARGQPRQAAVAAERHMEFEFDLEYGTPLYAATFDPAGPSTVTEVRAVNYAPVDPAVFGFEIRANARGQVPTANQPRGLRPQTRESTHTSRMPIRPALHQFRTVWLTGIPGAGKTTIARATERLLRQLNIPCCVLDGDEIRAGLSSDLGLSRQHRSEQARRVAHVAVMLAESGVIPLVALVSPYADDRERARDIHRAKGVEFLEVWVDTPVEVCIGRDPKGLYAADRAATPEHEVLRPTDGSGMTGVSAPYEQPVNHDLTLSGIEQQPSVAAAQIVERLVAPLGRATVLTFD